VSRWLARHNHYRISLVAGQTDNPDQRIAEDVYRFINGGSDGSNTAYGIYDFSILLISTVSSLVSFAIVLWGLSKSFMLPGTNIILPGFLFWLSVLGRPVICGFRNTDHPSHRTPAHRPVFSTSTHGSRLSIFPAIRSAVISPLCEVTVLAEQAALELRRFIELNEVTVANCGGDIAGAIMFVVGAVQDKEHADQIRHLALHDVMPFPMRPYRAIGVILFSPAPISSSARSMSYCACKPIPERRRRAKRFGKPQRRVGGDCGLLIDQPLDPRARHTDHTGHGEGRKLHRHEERLPAMLVHWR
jgi:hypothetical protein